MAGTMTFEAFVEEFPGERPGPFEDSGRLKTRRAYEKLRGSAKVPYDRCGYVAQFWVRCQGRVEGRILSFDELEMPDLTHYSETQFDSELLGVVFEAVGILLNGAPALVVVEIGRERSKNHVHVLCEPGVLTIGRRDRKVFTPARYLATVRYFVKPPPFTKANAEGYRDVKGLQERAGRRFRPVNLGKERVTVSEAQEALGVNLLSPTWQKISRDTEEYCRQAEAHFSRPVRVWSMPIRLGTKPKPKPRTGARVEWVATGIAGGVRGFTVRTRDKDGVLQERHMVQDDTLRTWIARAVEARRAAQNEITALGKDRAKVWEVERDAGLKDVRPYCDEPLIHRQTGPPVYVNGPCGPPLPA